MQYSELLTSFIRQAEEETEPNEEWDSLFPYELTMLRRLVPAIHSQSDELLLVTVLEMKAQLDARTVPIYTILATAVDMLADELEGKPSYKTIACPRCGAAISTQGQDIRFGARYTCRNCDNDVVLPGDEIAQA